MKIETKNILHSTPFNTYDDLFSAVFNNKASIHLSNSACRQIVETQKPILANFGLHIGIIPSAIITIAFSVCSTNYYLLLLILLECVFPYAIYFLNNYKIKTWYIAALVVLVNLLFVELPLFIFVASLCWLICLWTVSWWQKTIYIRSIKILQYNEDAFAWAFNSHNLLFKDCYGNIYSKLRQTQSEAEAYERLLKVLKIGAGTEGIDNAIVTLSAFYLKKGKEIPNELFSGADNLSEQEKRKNLLRILEIGTGLTGIENVTNKLIEFYKVKSVSFPDDIL